MSTADVIELDKHSGDHEEISDQASQGSKKPKLSNIYEIWRFEPAGKRDATHHGARCIPCKQHAEKKGLTLDPAGTCLADIRAMLAHVKKCEHQQKADRQRATTELQTRRTKSVKRGFGALQDSEAVSSGSGSSRQQGMSSFMALIDRPLSDMEQKSLSSCVFKPPSVVTYHFRSGMTQLSESCCSFCALSSKSPQGRSCPHASWMLVTRLQRMT